MYSPCPLGTLPDPKKPRTMHGTLIMKENVGVPSQYWGRHPHVVTIQFLSTFFFNDDWWISMTEQWHVSITVQKLLRVKRLSEHLGFNHYCRPISDPSRPPWLNPSCLSITVSHLTSFKWQIFKCHHIFKWQIDSGTERGSREGGDLARTLSSPEAAFIPIILTT